MNTQKAVRFPSRPVAHYGEPFLMQVPVISASHFPEDSIDGLFELAYWVANDQDSCILVIEDLEEQEPQVQAVIDHFRSLNYSYLRISAEVGDIVEGLPVYDW